MQILKNKKIFIFIGFLLVVIIGLLIYLFTKKNVENMNNTLDSTQANRNLIEGIVREIYSNDLSRLRNLDATINDLQTQIANGRVTIPAGIQSNDLIMKGPILLDYNSATHPANPNSKYDGAIYRQDGQMYIASDDFIRFRRHTQENTDPHRIQFDTRNGDANFNGKINSSHSEVSFNSNEGPEIILTNTDKDWNLHGYTWKIFNMRGPYGNNLTFYPYNKDLANGGPRLRLNDSGGAYISGGLYLDGNFNMGGNEITPDKLFDLMNTQIGFIKHGELRVSSRSQQTFTITFGSRFKSTPVIQTSYNRYHEHWDRASRYEITVWDITNLGFKLKIRTWGGGKNEDSILWGGVIGWIAISSCCPPQYIDGTNNNSISNNYPTEY